MHPSRIPLAYMYKEGDYATRIDVMLLTWRPWQQDDFPPPDDPLAQDNHHGQPHQYDGNAAPLTHSSSSSSNDAPSEPTIDYSCWPPRSFQSRSNLQHIWRPKCKIVQPPPPLNSSPPSHLLPSDTISHLLKRMLTHHKRRSSLATENPISPQNPLLIRFLTQVLSPSFLDPIRINFFLSLNGNYSDNSTWAATQNSFLTSQSLPMSLVLPTPKKNEAIPIPLVQVYISPPATPLNPYYKISFLSSPSPLPQRALLQRSLNPSPPPQRPLQEIISFTYLLKASFLGQVQLSTTPLLKQFLGRLILPSSIFSDASKDHILIAPTHSPQHLSLPLPEDSSQLTDITNNLTVSAPNPKNTVHVFSSNALNNAQEIYSTTMTDKFSLNLQSAAQDAKGQDKSVKGPIRRSQRIREKQRINFVTPKTPDRRKSKEKTLTIPFDLTSSQAPMDTNKALAIFQATGLQIDDHIEELIESTLKQDQAYEKTHPPVPTTPIHDPVPPMTVPDFDLPL